MSLNKRSSAVVVGAALGMFVATVVWRFLTFTGFPNDHYAHLALAQQMLLGERPVRDFSDPGWPLTYLMSAAGWWLAGERLAVEWTIVAAGFALGAAFTVVAARRLSGSVRIGLLVALCGMLIHPRSYSYPKVLAYGAAAWAMCEMAADPSRRRILAMALVTAVSFLFRHDHGVYIAAAAAICLALGSRESWRVTTGRLFLLSGATAALLAPWALFVALNGGLAPYFERGLEYARAEANATVLKSWPAFHLMPGRPLFGLARSSRPLAQVEWQAETTADLREELERRYSLEFVRADGLARFYYVHDTTDRNVRSLADDPHVAGTSGLGRVQRPVWREWLADLSPLRLAPAVHSRANAEAWLYWLFWLLPLACLAIAAIRLHRFEERWPGENAAVTGTAVMALLVNSGFLRDPLSARLADAIVPPSLAGAWLLGLCWSARWRRRGMQILVQGVSLVLLVPTLASIASVADLREKVEYTGVVERLAGVRARASWVTHLLQNPHRQTIAPPSRVSEALMPFFGYLDRCTATGDQLIVTSDYPDVPVLAGRKFASDGVTFGVWYSSVRYQDRTIDEMRRDPPLFTVLLDDQDFERRFERVVAYVSREYVPMAEIPGEAGRISILRHRGRVATRVDATTGWPCFT